MAYAKCSREHPSCTKEVLHMWLQCIRNHLRWISHWRVSAPNLFQAKDHWVPAFIPLMLTPHAVSPPFSMRYGSLSMSQAFSWALDTEKSHSLSLHKLFSRTLSTHRPGQRRWFRSPKSPRNLNECRQQRSRHRELLKSLRTSCSQENSVLRGWAFVDRGSRKTWRYSIERPSCKNFSACLCPNSPWICYSGHCSIHGDFISFQWEKLSMSAKA